MDRDELRLQKNKTAILCAERRSVDCSLNMTRMSLLFADATKRRVDAPNCRQHNGTIE